MINLAGIGQGMISKHLLYGLRGAAVVAAAEAVGSRLSCQLQQRFSDDSGQYYVTEFGEATIRAEESLDFEDELKEPDFPEYQTLITGGGTTEAPSLEGVQAGGVDPTVADRRDLHLTQNLQSTSSHDSTEQ